MTSLTAVENIPEGVGVELKDKQNFLMGKTTKTN